MARYIEDFYRGTDLYSEGDQVEDDIVDYIKKYPPNEYEDILKKDPRWTVFYHFTDMRRGLLDWYDFGENSEILEIGGGMGAITGLLCEKGKHVTTIELSKKRAQALQIRHKDIINLDIYVGNLVDIPFDRKFDVITVVGVLEYQGTYIADDNPYEAFMSKLKKLLKPGGRILVAIENQFGLKYWCGMSEDHSGIPFDGISGYKYSNKAKTFSKASLTELLNNSGLTNLKFYYPLPDYKLPQLIYSEDYSPQKYMHKRMIPYYLGNQSLISREMDLYEEVIKNKVFEFFANSFLVECRTDDKRNPANFIVTSSDRKREFQMTTVIYRDGTVKKSAMNRLGVKNLYRAYQNLDALKERDIPIVNQKIENESLISDYISDRSLDEVLGDIARYKNKKEFFSMLQKYIGILKKSSMAVNHVNEMFTSSSYCIDNNDTILQNGYLDLLPHNCFVIENNITAYDQEFVLPNTPLKFILFRAIRNLYFFDKEIENYIPLLECIQAFGLDINWRCFDEADNQITADLKNSETNRNFWIWASIDDSLIDKNIINLASPIKYHSLNAHVFHRWLQFNAIGRSIGQELLKRKVETIAIMGYGNLGEILCTELSQTNIKIEYIIDNNKTEMDHGIPIYKLQGKLKKVDAVVICLAEKKQDITNKVSDCTSSPVIYLSDILFSDKLF